MENITAEILQNGEYKIIELHGVKLLVFKSGTVYRWFRNKYWKTVELQPDNFGYYKIGIQKDKIKHYIKIHRIIAFVFLNLDINDKGVYVDHIDANKINNHTDNLRIVPPQENTFNRPTAKGYSYDKRAKSWKASIKKNGVLQLLGYFKKEEEARQAYLNAKTIHHIIPDRKNNN